jgi:AsmA protein
VIKPIKIMLGCIVALILILLIMVFVLLYIIDINDFKAQISTQVKNTTGRTLTMNGHLKLTVYPKLSITTGAIVLGNPTEFEGTFMSADNISVGVQTVPLLSKKIIADTLHIQGFTLNLSTNKQGRHNWDHGWLSTANTGTNTLQTLLMGLSIKGIHISNARINWANASTRQTINLSHINLTTSAYRINTPLHSQFSLSILDKTRQLTASLTGHSTVNVSDNLGIFTLADSEIHTTVTSPSIPIKATPLSLHSAAIIIDTTLHTVTSSDLHGKLADLAISTDVLASWANERHTLSGKAHIAAFNPRVLGQQLGLSLPASTNNTTFQHLNSQFSFRYADNTIEINPLMLTLDDSILTGSVQIKNTDNPVTTFNVAIDSLDADHYLPPTNISAKPTTPTTSLAMLPVDKLRKLHATGTLTIHSLTVKGSHSENTQLKLHN